VPFNLLVPFVLFIERMSLQILYTSPEMVVSLKQDNERSPMADYPLPNAHFEYKQRDTRLHLSFAATEQLVCHYNPLCLQNERTQASASAAAAGPELHEDAEMHMPAS